MRAWQLKEFGFESLELVDLPVPNPGPGEVLIRVRAVSFNYRDLLVVKGLYNPKMTRPRIPCSDGAGEIIAVGEGVTSWQPGDRVNGIFLQNWLDGPPTAETNKGALGGDIDGMLAEYVVLPAKSIVGILPYLSYSEAATLPCAAVTAWNALTAGKVGPGSTVLIQGTGGVSIFALQMAKAMGARVLGISSSDEKLERAKSLGLDEGLNYRTTPDWERWAFEQTGDVGVDLVVEVGGAGTLPRSLRAVKIGGTIAQIGVLTGAADVIPLPLIFHKQLHIHGIYVGSRAHFLAMNAFLDQHEIRPVCQSHYWSQARDTLASMESAAHFGKLVVELK
ncbi:MAG: NAD(P)-dependent alcohol dehydrogenase [Acidobacteriota bacterium]|nr:NAD(P)-dependent alcohol dehydrogenase [Acidobacteriota bacterium]